MFHNREDAAVQLAEKLRGRRFREPVILAIPRGGVVIGTVLARVLRADLDVILPHKLRTPGQPDLAFGAVAENGQVFPKPQVKKLPDRLADYLAAERGYQLAEMDRRRRLYRAVRPPVPIRGRTVIVADDGIATGSTLEAGLHGLSTRHPHEILVAVPVAPPDPLEEVGRWCDEVVCLLCPQQFRAIGQFYEDFAPVEDEQVVSLLRAATTSRMGRVPILGKV